MAFRIKGLNRDTGEPKTLLYEVANEQEAIKMAGDQGFVVEGVCYVSSVSDKQPAPEVYTSEYYAEVDKHVLEKQKSVRAELAIDGRIEPDTEPVDGHIFIGIAVGIAILGGMAFAIKESSGPVLGYIGFAVSGMFYFAGVIRWAVSGAQFVQLDRMQRKQSEIIDLLEPLAPMVAFCDDASIARRHTDGVLDGSAAEGVGGDRSW